eukprot:GILI01008725.1.p1 GENE.GILI01008725.1~~GILI01008725.1.p1  ORF type:complete len:571 (+),score=107.44 GILI01008725.1:47-1714(+)
MELKAISVPQSLLFLLSFEYDIFLCLTTVGIKNGFRLVINTALAPSYRLLLESGAKRFGLTVTHGVGESVISSDGRSARMPLLRYVDYIPGGLHVDELLNSFGVDIKMLPRKAKSASNVTKESSVFEACFIDYSPYVSDEALHDVHGCGFYQTLDRGLSLATHAHLLHVTFGADPKAKNTSAGQYAPALRSFLIFSGWEKLDLRFEDDSKQSAVVVLPSTQDSNDLMEKYENEESDNEVEDLLDLTVATAALFRLNFHMRPVAPTVSVPYIEDATLRRLRGQYWTMIEAFWKQCHINSNTVVVSNLYDTASLDEILKLFGTATVLSASMTEDESPSKRRRVFVTFGSSDEAKEALGLDGKNTHGKSLRIHAAPPYIDTARRGKAVASRAVGVPALVPQTPALTVPSPSPAGHDPLIKSPGLNVTAKEFVPKFAIGSGTFTLPPPYLGGSPALTTAPLPPAYSGTTTPSAPPAAPPAYTVSPAATAALPPSYTPAPATRNSESPINSHDSSGTMPPTYSLPPPYARMPPPPHPLAAPPPAYTPSPSNTPESPMSQL